MLTINSLRNFYYVPDVTDMRCGYHRLIPTIFVPLYSNIKVRNMDFENEIDLNELSDRINNLRELEDQENSPELPDEYRNMDKETIIRMLLASQHENERLHARLDKQDEEAKAREERLNVRIDELTRVNTVSSESQIKLMDQLAELHNQLKQMGAQYGDLLVELKRQKDLNRQSGKEKYATTKQNVKKDDQDKDDSDDGQRGNW